MTETPLSFENKLKEINHSLYKNYRTVNNLSLSRGQLGISLYFYTYYRHTRNEQYFNISQEILTNSFNILEYGGHSLKSIKELNDLGRYLLFLHKENKMDDSITSILEEIDDLLIPHLYDQLKQKQLDPVMGAISIGYYLAERLRLLPTEAAKKALLAVITKIEELAIIESDNSIYWAGNTENTNYIQLGISHGISGILLFLARMHELGLCNNASFLTKGMNYLLKQQQNIQKNHCFFPIAVKSGEKPSKFINLAYGDIGIAYSLLEISKIISDDATKLIAFDVFTHYAMPENRVAYQVYDANLIYGSAGVAVIFKRLNRETHDPLFGDTAGYWLNKTLDLLSARNEYAGFEPHWNPIYPETYTSIAEGISGIGLAMLYFQNADLDYLFSIVNYN